MNPFTELVKRKDTNTLMNMLENSGRYDKMAVAAAVQELIRRGVDVPEDLISKFPFEHGPSHHDFTQHDSPKPFSRQTVFVVSALLSPLIGSILTIVDLVTVKKWRRIFICICFVASFYFFLTLILSNSYRFFGVILFNLTGAAILSELIHPKPNQ